MWTTRIGALRGLDGVLQPQFTAGVLAVAQNDDRFSAGFIGELIVCGEIDGVVEIRAAAATGRKRALRDDR